MVSYAEVSNFQSYYMEVWEKGIQVDVEWRDEITHELLSVMPCLLRDEAHRATVGINLYCGDFTEAELITYLSVAPLRIFPPDTDALVNQTSLPKHVMEDSGFTAYRRWEGVFKVTNRQFWSMTCATAPSTSEAEAIRLIMDVVDMPPPYRLPEFIQASILEIDMQNDVPRTYAEAAQRPDVPEEILRALRDDGTQGSRWRRFRR